MRYFKEVEALQYLGSDDDYYKISEMIGKENLTNEDGYAFYIDPVYGKTLIYYGEYVVKEAYNKGDKYAEVYTMSGEDFEERYKKVNKEDKSDG